MRVRKCRSAVVSYGGAIGLAMSALLGSAILLTGTAGADFTDGTGSCPSVTASSDAGGSTSSGAATSSETCAAESSEPAVSEPAVTEPVATEPAATEPAVTEPPVTEPPVTSPTTSSPAPTTSPTTSSPAPTSSPDSTTSTPIPTSSSPAPTSTSTPAEPTSSPSSPSSPAPTSTKPDVPGSGDSGTDSDSDDSDSGESGAANSTGTGSGQPRLEAGTGEATGLSQQLMGLNRPDQAPSMAGVPGGLPLTGGADAILRASLQTPGFGDLGIAEAEDPTFAGSQQNTGSATALPDRPQWSLGGPGLGAVCALAMVGAALARTWAVRSRVNARR